MYIDMVKFNALYVLKILKLLMSYDASKNKQLQLQLQLQLERTTLKKSYHSEISFS